MTMTADRPGFTEDGRRIEIGTVAEYIAHLSAGAVRVRFLDGTEGVAHPACFPELRNPPQFTLAPDGTGWIAYPRGKSSPVLRPVPGNVRPATRAWWPTREAAIEDLTAWAGCAVEAVRP